MIHFDCAEYKHVLIRPLDENDIELLRQWRNDEKLSAFLSPVGHITEEMQRNWFRRYLKDEDIRTFAIEDKGELGRTVGSVSLYGFNNGAAEVGRIMVGDPQARGRKLGFYGKLLAMYVGYQRLGVEKFRNDVHEDNIPARTNDERSGFTVRGRHPFSGGGYELEMEMTKEDFFRKHGFLQDISLYQCGGKDNGRG